MKRLFRTLFPLLVLLAGVPARADLVTPFYDMHPESSLPLILIVALLVVTALLVRHFTRKEKK